MKMIDLLKEKLFSDETDRNALIATIDGTENIDDALKMLFLEYKEKDLQKILAPFLRAATIKHMWQATTPWSKWLKEVQIQQLGEQELLAKLQSQDPGRQQKTLSKDERQLYQLTINNYGTAAFEEYLQLQARNTAWGEDLDAASLADLLDLTMGVTLVSQEGKESLTYNIRECLEERPRIICYNVAQNHWFFYPADYHGTLGDGNCLYNSFAQALRQIILYEAGALRQSISQHSSEKLQSYVLKIQSKQSPSARSLSQTGRSSTETPKQVEHLGVRKNSRKSRASKGAVIAVQGNTSTPNTEDLVPKITLQEEASTLDTPRTELAPAESIRNPGTLSVVQPELETQKNLLLQEIIDRLKKEYLLEIKQQTLSHQQKLIFNTLKTDSKGTDSFLRLANTLELQSNALPIILKCIKAIHVSKSKPQITVQQLSELSNALSNVENAAPLYKQWHQFASLVKHFITQVGLIFGQNWSFDTMYRGPMRNQFWATCKEIENVIDEVDPMSSPDCGDSALLLTHF